MGNSGSFIAKAKIRNNLLIFTRYTADDITKLMVRANDIFPDQYTLSRKDLHELLGFEVFTPSAAHNLFDSVFNKDLFHSKLRSLIAHGSLAHQSHPIVHNSLDSIGFKFHQSIGNKPIADKYEVICSVILLANISDNRKIEFFFNLFDFNKKGYLLREEIQLLIMSLMYSVFMIDDSLFIPTRSICDSISKIAMDSYSETFMSRITKVQGVKRRNLSNMIMANSNISSLFHAFQGHSNQIILASNEIWRDDAFPAIYSSINLASPSADIMPMPPVDFVQWIRYSGSDASRRSSFKLFTHTTRFLQTIDRVTVYQGPGILGQGTFRSKSLLANKWFQNALALIAAKPSAFMSLFQLTSQENQGRYCCQFYEGISWRLVYCDNRIPCGIDGEPMFLASSDSHEYCLLILEKAFAKYLGSYSHIAKCSLRADSLLTSLRMLTGGHVFNEVVDHYEWSSGYVLPSNQNGVEFIQQELDKGTIIGFSRSENMLTHASSVARPPHERFPCGVIYPLLGIVDATEKKYFVFKDSWQRPGIPHRNVQNQDVSLGQLNTFRIQAEDVESYFDAFVLSTYPDISRSSSKAYSWQSQCVEHEISPNTSKPSVFCINVVGGKAEFDGQANNRRDDEPYHSMSINDNMKTVDLAFTISSVLPWSIIGDPKYRAKTRLVMLPSYETRILLEQLKADSSRKLDHSFNEDLEFIHISNTSWSSCRIKLFPGVYYVFADISIDASFRYEDLHRLSSPHENVRNHYPLIESANKIILHTSSYENFSTLSVHEEDIPPNNLDFSELDGEASRPIISLVNEDQSESNSSGVVDMLYNLYNQRQVMVAQMEAVRTEFNKFRMICQESIPVAVAEKAPENDKMASQEEPQHTN
jgi:hypothetical protein